MTRLSQHLFRYPLSFRCSCLVTFHIAPCTNVSCPRGSADARSVRKLVLDARLPQDASVTRVAACFNVEGFQNNLNRPVVPFPEKKGREEREGHVSRRCDGVFRSGLGWRVALLVGWCGFGGWRLAGLGLSPLGWGLVRCSVGGCSGCVLCSAGLVGVAASGVLVCALPLVVCLLASCLLLRCFVCCCLLVGSVFGVERFGACL